MTVLAFIYIAFFIIVLGFSFRSEHGEGDSFKPTYGIPSLPVAMSEYKILDGV